MNKKWALLESRNRREFRKLGRTKLGVKEGRSSVRSMENKPEGEEIM